MAAQREDLVRIARTAVAGIHRPADLENPVTYDPDEWVLEALAAAWKAGAAEARTEEAIKVAVEDSKPRCRDCQVRAAKYGELCAECVSGYDL